MYHCNKYKYQMNGIWMHIVEFIRSKQKILLNCYKSTTYFNIHVFKSYKKKLLNISAQKMFFFFQKKKYGQMSLMRKRLNQQTMCELISNVNKNIFERKEDSCTRTNNLKKFADKTLWSISVSHKLFGDNYWPMLDRMNSFALNSKMINTTKM